MKDEKEKKNQGLTLTSNQNSKIQNPYMNFHHLQNQQKDKEKP